MLTAAQMHYAQWLLSLSNKAKFCKIDYLWHASSSKRTAVEEMKEENRTAFYWFTNLYFHSTDERKITNTIGPKHACSQQVHITKHSHKLAHKYVASIAIIVIQVSLIAVVLW